MKKLTRILVVALAAFSITAMAGCAKGNVSSAASEKPAESKNDVSSAQPEKDYKDTKFTIAWWGSDARHTATTKLIEEFEKDYKNLKIDVEYFGWGDYWTKMTTHSAAKDLPDVLQMDYGKISQFVESNLLFQLDSYIDSKAIDLSDTADTTMAAGKIDGKMYGIVTGVNSPAGIYNPELVKAAGVTLSQTPTVDEYRNACKQIYEKTGAKVPYFLDYYHRAVDGVNEWSDDGKSCGFDADALAQCWENDMDGIEQGWIAGPNDKTYESTEAAFADKAYWCAYLYSNQLASFEKASNLDLELIALPSSDKNSAPNFMKPNMLWSVAANSKTPDLAAAFLNYFVNNTNTYDICGVDRGMPVSSKIRDYVSPNFDEAEKKYAAYQTLLEDGHASAIYPPVPAKASEAQAIMDEYGEKVRYGQFQRSELKAKAQECIDKMNAVLQAQ